MVSQPALGLVVLSSMLWMAACQKDLPPGPSEFETGITVYEHANFQGESAHITSDIANLEDYKGPRVTYTYGFLGSVPTATPHNSWDDCISSVRVAPGWSATLYRDPHYEDDQVTVTTDVPNFTAIPHDCPEDGLNDCVSSIRIRRP